MRGLLVGIAISACLYLAALGWHESGLSFPWSGQSVDILEGPEVCNGVLSVMGELQDEATIGEGDFLTFSIYRRDELKPGYSYRVIDPVLSFQEPAPPGEFYSSLPNDVQIAKRLKASPSDTAFELVSDVPRDIATSPSDYELGIWGFSSPSEGRESVLRSAILKACPK